MKTRNEYAELTARLRLAYEADSLDNHKILLEAAEAIDELEAHTAIIARIDAERAKYKGVWHTSKYYLGFVDGLRKARSIVDGTIDEEKYVVPSGGENGESW